MRSSDPDVYAAGDVVQATELISGEKRIVGIWKNAALQGACAGRAIAAELAGNEPSRPCLESLAMNTICVRETLFISAGTIMLDDNSRVETEVDDTMTVVRIFEGDGDTRRLTGFNIACDVDEAAGMPTTGRHAHHGAYARTAPERGNETLAQSKVSFCREG